jgi:hypothetical protein
MAVFNIAGDGNPDGPLDPSSEGTGEQTIPDLDDVIHQQEDEGQPSAMPPETEEDFEKAIRGPERPSLPRIPPNIPD